MQDPPPPASPDATSTPPLPPVLAPTLMMVFWMLLGGVAGIKMMESIWRFRGVAVGEMTIAVPVGGAVGALAGALLGLIQNPRLLVLLMAVFAGASAGGGCRAAPLGRCRANWWPSRRRTGRGDCLGYLAVDGAQQGARTMSNAVPMRRRYDRELTH